ncbi:MAG: molybdopterin-guanine dinucleotide biosynthesis protein B [Methylococcus sp.]|jgi:molybdopterin-guanine dinucleotide biosynthesis protein B|nr:MAG: molybdopterin-guanine dinucleotide biosynthesis protein B [Methylococcus sp.]
MQTPAGPVHNLSNARVPLIGFAARSGTGKTTLLCRLIPWLNQQGLRIGLIKHAHHEFEVDKPGKDSYELRKAGASPVMLSSSQRRAVITEHPQTGEPSLNEELRFMDQDAVDLLLVEGFKQAPFPKLELHRPALGHALLYPQDPCIIAIASDAELTPSPHIPCLNLNDPEQIGKFLLGILGQPRP